MSSDQRTPERDAGSAHAEQVPVPRPFIFCLVPASRADRLLEPLRRHFADDPDVAVIVERRAERSVPQPTPGDPRQHRRAPVAERDLLRALAPELRHAARDVRLVQRMEPVGRRHQQTTTEDVVAAIRAGDPEAASELWWRSTQRVRSRLGDAAFARVGIGMLGRILDELDSFRAGDEPFHAWLDRVVDRYQEPPGRFDPLAP